MRSPAAAVAPLLAVIALAVSIGAAACAPARRVSATPQSPGAAAAASQLPDGRGREILLASCTSCHDLREVTKFRGFYNRAQWRDIVVTMVEYGADVAPADVEVLADYLQQHLGRGVTASSP